MGDVVKATRRYDSSHRREQAESTRAQILRSAQRRFESDGYVPTTVAAIAKDAGVAVKTVYLAFETKSGLLRALWGVLLRGERDVPVASLETYQRVLREPDPAAQLRLNAANARATKERIGSILRVIESAAAQDEEMAAFWQHIETDFRANQRVIVESLADKQALRTELDVDRATDILWTLNHPYTWHLLVGRRGWTPDEFESWFGDACIRELLRTP